jgi:hypothetical protein
VSQFIAPSPFDRVARHRRSTARASGARGDFLREMGNIGARGRGAGVEIDTRTVENPAV